LKKEFEAKNMENLEPAIEKLNTVFQAASEDMYNASNAEGGNTTEGATEEGNTEDEVTDVDFEEVEEK
jgi:molecular chaperone DnaK